MITKEVKVAFSVQEGLDFEVTENVIANVKRALESSEEDFKIAMEKTGSITMMTEFDDVYMAIMQSREMPGKVFVRIMGQNEWLDKISSSKKSRFKTYVKKARTDLDAFEIWIEGFQIQGNSSEAMFLGTSRGNNFEEACKSFVENNESFKKSYNPEDNTYWGCRLFNNEVDARKSFG